MLFSFFLLYKLAKYFTIIATRTFLQLLSIINVLANIKSKIVWHATRWNFSLHDATLQWISELTNYRIFTLHLTSKCEAQVCILRRSLMFRCSALTVGKDEWNFVIVIIVQLARDVQSPVVYVLCVVVRFPVCTVCLAVMPLFSDTAVVSIIG